MIFIYILFSYIFLFLKKSFLKRLKEVAASRVRNVSGAVENSPDNVWNNYYPEAGRLPSLQANIET